MDQLVTALISGGVALVVAGLGMVAALAQVRRERRRLLIDPAFTVSMELIRARIAAYPEAMAALLPLSEASSEPPTAEVAWHVAERLNTWLYSAGGLCASATARDALLGLRQGCRRWAADGRRPDDLYDWRNLAVATLRFDLGLRDLEDHDLSREPDPLGRVREELRLLRGRAAR